MQLRLSTTMAIAAIAAFSGDASATTVQLGKISESSLLGTCNTVGGKFTNSGSTHNNQSYGCERKNCDGKGGDCVVTCDTQSNECYGHSPALTLPPSRRNVLGVLNFVPDKASGPPDSGLLGPSPPGSPSGPSGMGSTKPTAPPGGKLY